MSRRASAMNSLQPWKVRLIEILPNQRGAEVTFGVDGHAPIRFRTRRFGVGRRGAKSAALARFAAHAGFGGVQSLYHFLVGMPHDFAGFIFSESTFAAVMEPQDSPRPRRRCASEAAA